MADTAHLFDRLLLSREWRDAVHAAGNVHHRQRRERPSVGAGRRTRRHGGEGFGSLGPEQIREHGAIGVPGRVNSRVVQLPAFAGHRQQRIKELEVAIALRARHALPARATPVGIDRARRGQAVRIDDHRLGPALFDAPFLGRRLHITAMPMEDEHHRRAIRVRRGGREDQGLAIRPFDLQLDALGAG